MYNDLKNIQKLLWKNDDRMDQDDLFELQDLVSELILIVAEKENRIDDLVKEFPWIYEDVIV
jgi:hypothetical protein